MALLGFSGEQSSVPEKGKSMISPKLDFQDAGR